MKIQIYIASFCLFLCSMASCSRLDLVGMFNGTSPTIDERFEVSQQYNTKHGFVTLLAPRENYHVYVCTDTHIADTRNCWENFIDTYRADSLCPVAVHLGDIIDAKTDFQYVQDALSRVSGRSSRAKDTLMAVAGNHDIYFSQWEDFIAAFKTSTYYFIVETPSGARDLYVVYDSADGTVGSKQLKWLENTLQWASRQGFRHIVGCTHTHLFKRDGSQGHTSNFTLEETYALLDLLTRYGVQMVWSGHDHIREITRVKGMTCIVVDSMKDDDKNPGYMLVTMGEKITYDFLPASK